MTDYSLDMQKGLIAALKGDAAIAALVSTRVYSRVPQKTVFPYLVADVLEMTTDFDTKEDANSKLLIEIKAFSRTPSKKEASDISIAIYDLLNRGETNITLDNGVLTLLQQAPLSSIFIENDGVTWQAVRRFESLID